VRDDPATRLALMARVFHGPTGRAPRQWASRRRRPCGCGWSSVLGRRGATGIERTNASIVAGYREHRNLAETETAAERFFVNVALLRVLYARALAAARGLALGPCAPLGRLLGDPLPGRSSSDTSGALPGQRHFMALMERVGMRWELHAVRESLHRSGRWLHTVGYAILEQEWSPT
jgi:hypothetical protein